MATVSAVELKRTGNSAPSSSSTRPLVEKLRSSSSSNRLQIDTPQRSSSSSRPKGDPNQRSSSSSRPKGDTNQRSSSSSRPKGDTNQRSSSSSRPNGDTNQRSSSSSRPKRGKPHSLEDNSSSSSARTKGEHLHSPVDDASSSSRPKGDKLQSSAENLNSGQRKQSIHKTLVNVLSKVRGKVPRTPSVGDASEEVARSVEGSEEGAERRSRRDREGRGGSFTASPGVTGDATTPAITLSSSSSFLHPSSSTQAVPSQSSPSEKDMALVLQAGSSEPSSAKTPSGTLKIQNSSPKAPGSPAVKKHTPSKKLAADEPVLIRVGKEKRTGSLDDGSVVIRVGREEAGRLDDGMGDLDADSFNTLREFESVIEKISSETDLSTGMRTAEMDALAEQKSRRGAVDDGKTKKQKQPSPQTSESKHDKPPSSSTPVVEGSKDKQPSQTPDKHQATSKSPPPPVAPKKKIKENDVNGRKPSQNPHIATESSAELPNAASHKNTPHNAQVKKPVSNTSPAGQTSESTHTETTTKETKEGKASAQNPNPALESPATETLTPPGLSSNGDGMPKASPPRSAALGVAGTAPPGKVSSRRRPVSEMVWTSPSLSPAPSAQGGGGDDGGDGSWLGSPQTTSTPKPKAPPQTDSTPNPLIAPQTTPTPKSAAATTTPLPAATPASAKITTNKNTVHTDKPQEKPLSSSLPPRISTPGEDPNRSGDDDGGGDVGDGEESLSCYNHRGTYPQRYCSDHSQPICLECAFELHRSCRDVQVLETAARGRRQELDTMCEALLMLKAQWESVQASVDTLQARLDAERVKTLADIQPAPPPPHPRPPAALLLSAQWDSVQISVDILQAKLDAEWVKTPADIQKMTEDATKAIRIKGNQLTEEAESLYANEGAQIESRDDRVRRALTSLQEVLGQAEGALASRGAASLLRQFGKLKGRCDALVDTDVIESSEVLDCVRVTSTWFDDAKHLPPAKLTLEKRPIVSKKNMHLSERGLETFRRISKKRRQNLQPGTYGDSGVGSMPVYTRSGVRSSRMSMATSVVSTGSLPSILSSSHSMSFLDGPQSMFEFFAGLESDKYPFGLGDICVMQPRLSILVTYLTSDLLRVFPWREESSAFMSEPLGCTLCCITQLSNETVAVTSSNSDQLSFLKVGTDSVTLTHSLSMKKEYRAVTSLDYRTLALATDTKRSANNVISIIRFDSADYRSYTPLKTIGSRHGGVPMIKFLSKTLFKVPYSMCSSPTGHIVVSDSENRALLVLTQEGEKRYIFQPPKLAGVIDTPGGVACSPAGHMYLVDSCEQRVLRFDRTGKFRKVVLSQEDGLEWPIAVACVDESTLCVAEFYGQVKVFRIR